MTIKELNELADYNTRVSKGIQHTPEFTKRMKLLQFRLDKGEAIDG